MTAPTQRRSDDVVQILIMLAVAGMAGAASFRHVHDWTMHNSPAGTGDWFGWANAMVTELIPLAAGLEVRRRHRLHGKAGLYPIVLILGAVALSLTGQFAEATRSLAGWIISAIPAVGFLALVKLVLSRPAVRASELQPIQVDASAVDEHVDPESPAEFRPEPTSAVVSVPHQDIPTHLLAGARFAATQHHQATGQLITPGELATRMSLTAETATGLLTELGHPTNSSLPVNGIPILGGETR